jgi:hypothetical protein
LILTGGTVKHTPVRALDGRCCVGGDRLSG